MRQPAPPIRACLDWYIRMTGATATESTRDQIIHAAADSLLENGYSGTSVRSIASKAGVAIGNLQYYFPTTQAGLRNFTVAIRTSGSPLSMLPAATLPT